MGRVDVATKKQSVEIEYLTLQQLAERIDEESRYLLGMTGYEFVTRLQDGKLDYRDSQFYIEVRMLWNLAKESQRPKIIAKLRRLAEQDSQYNGHDRSANARSGSNGSR